MNMTLETTICATLSLWLDKHYLIYTGIRGVFRTLSDIYDGAFLHHKMNWSSYSRMGLVKFVEDSL